VNRTVRVNKPVEVLSYNDPVEMFAKPEPTVNKMHMDKRGNVDLAFSSEMEYPDNWKQMFEEQKSRRLQLGQSGPANNSQPFLIV
jgi:hypothetical protein